MSGNDYHLVKVMADKESSRPCIFLHKIARLALTSVLQHSSLPSSLARALLSISATSTSSSSASLTNCEDQPGLLV